MCPFNSVTETTGGGLSFFQLSTKVAQPKRLPSVLFDLLLVIAVCFVIPGEERSRPRCYPHAGFNAHFADIVVDREILDLAPRREFGDKNSC